MRARRRHCRLPGDYGYNWWHLMAQGTGSANDWPAARESGAVRETGVWYDDSGLPWQMVTEGARFTAQADVFGVGTVVMRGEVLGQALSYQLFDVSGNVVGYGEGRIDDDSHISYESYLPNGLIFASGQLHVNHMPN